MQGESYLRSSEGFDLNNREWAYVIPEAAAFRVHLNEDCYVLFEDLQDLGGDVFRVDEFFDAQTSFETDWLPRASKERTRRAFRDGDVSCFFDAKDIGKLIDKLHNETFIARMIRVFLRDEEVTPEELDDDLFERFMTLAERFGFEYCLGYARNANVLAEVAKGYKKKEARLKPLSQEQLYSVPLRRKGIKKSLGLSALGVAAATLAGHAGQLLVKSADWRLKVVGALVVGLSTVAGFAFGQQSSVVAKHAYSNPILTEGGGDIHYAT